MSGSVVRPQSPLAVHLALQDVAWRRGGLDGVSLTVAPGTCLAVVGGAGAGKSALLAVVAGRAAPDSGAVLAGGTAVTGMPPHRRGFGVVLPGDNLFAHLTVARNLALPRGEAPAALLAALGLGRRAAHRPGELSALELARAGLARALANRPRILLLDDPFAGCSPVERDLLAADLIRLRAARALTIMLATPDAADARRVAAETVAVLAGGRVAQTGTPALLYERPVSAEVARAMGAVNCLPGVLRAVEDDVAVIGLAGGAVVEAGIGDGLDIGAPCLVLVRPERIAVAAVAAAELGDGAIAAELRAIVDMGSYVRLHLSAGDAMMEVIRPAGAALAGLRPGRSVALAWQAQHAWTCPA